MDENIYIDTPTAYNHKGKFSHMTGQDQNKLHEIAKKIGLKRCWFENKRGMNRPHYDVKIDYYKAAISAGAIPLSLRDYREKCIEIFGEMYPSRKNGQTKLFKK